MQTRSPTLADHGWLLNRCTRRYGIADHAARGDRRSRAPAQADTGSVARRWLVGAGGWAVGTALAFLLLNPILAAFIVILGATIVVVAVLASDWDKHSTFEERELARSRKRASKWERTADVRARDRERWEAHQARKAQE
jgi:Flp pilus assembly protein TadB